MRDDASLDSGGPDRSPQPTRSRAYHASAGRRGIPLDRQVLALDFLEDNLDQAPCTCERIQAPCTSPPCPSRRDRRCHRLPSNPHRTLYTAAARGSPYDRTPTVGDRWWEKPDTCRRSTSSVHVSLWDEHHEYLQSVLLPRSPDMHYTSRMSRRRLSCAA